MILPIRAFGDPVLRAKARPINEDSRGLQELIGNMLETMRGADGAGLAAPQVGESVQLFVADLTQAWHALSPKTRQAIPPQPMVCINPEIVERSSETAEFGEGCLSIPPLVEEVRRPIYVKMRYLDRSFQRCEVDGISYTASVLQHEFDHLMGVLYIDYVPPERRRQLEEPLRAISLGEVRPEYPMQFHRRDRDDDV